MRTAVGRRWGALVTSALVLGVASTLAVPTLAAAEEGPAEPSGGAVVRGVPQAVLELGVVEEAVPLDSSPVGSLDVAGGEVSLDLGVDEAVSVQLPTAGRLDAATQVRGEAGEGFGVAVVPTAEGVQLVVAIDGASSPESFAFGLDLPDGYAPEVTSDGAVALRDADGAEVGYVEQPWAFDAAGAPVETRFVVEGDTLTQVVEHAEADVVYPITADPKIKGCNWQTATCVTFSKSETRRIADQSTNAAGVGALCGLLPHALIRVGCGVAFVPIWNSVKGTFKKAKREGKCVEVKLNRIPPAYNTPIGWKVVGC